MSNERSSEETTDDQPGLGCIAVVMPAIRPGIVTRDGTTVYPTGIEWLLAFAIKGCQWASDALPQAIHRQQLLESETNNGGGI